MAVLHAYAHLKFVETFRAFNDSFAAEDKTIARPWGNHGMGDKWGDVFALNAAVEVNLDRRDGKEFGRLLRNCALVRLVYESNEHNLSARPFLAR